MSVTPSRVRELVAQLPEAVEGAHHGHPDFRVRNKLFATLSEKETHAALRLTHSEARAMASARPQVFRLVSDRDPIGWVSAALDQLNEAELSDLLAEAWRLRAPAALLAYPNE